MSGALSPELQALFRRFGKAFNAVDVEWRASCVTPDCCWIMARGPEAPHGRIVSGRDALRAALLERDRDLTGIRFSEAQVFAAGDAVIGTAFRRPVTERDSAALMSLYQKGAADGGFEAGIRLAIEGILASPRFVFRFEERPATARAGQGYALTDFDLASRLSFFLWASAPDETLRKLAARAACRRPRCWISRSGACWPIPGRLCCPRALRRSGCACRISTSSTRMSGSIRTSTSSSRSPCAGRRSCSSRTWSARIAPCWRCSRPTIRS